MPISTIRHCILDLNNLKQVLVHDLLSTINIVSFVIFLTALNFGHLHCSYFKMFQSSCFLTSKTITLRHFVFMQTNFAFCQYFFIATSRSVNPGGWCRGPQILRRWGSWTGREILLYHIVYWK